MKKLGSNHFVEYPTVELDGFIRDLHLRTNHVGADDEVRSLDLLVVDSGHNLRETLRVDRLRCRLLEARSRLCVC
jgi:hypothetical protein